MLKELRKILLSIVDDIDCNNSNIDNEEDLYKIIDVLKEYTRKDDTLSKYQAYTFLNMSRAKFDNMVRSGEIPRGIKVQGFKELRWKRRTIEKLAKNKDK